VLALSVCPTCALPEIVGNAVLAGGAEEGTTAVCAELAGAELPAEFEAVTATLSVEPASAEATV
jgi:hypothetical protein